MFKQRIIYLSVFIFLILSNGFAQDYQLIWSDEFDGTQLNSDNWTFETGAGGWGNSELQFYTSRSANLSLADGIMTITALKESYSGSSYTSARIKTQGKKFWKYGKIEARMKLPYGQGLWPAFWMLGESISTVSWPACGEIDIMEMIGGSGRENTVYGTAHWDQNGHSSYGGDYTLSNGTFSDDFHVFSIVWTPQSITWFVDGIQYHIIDIKPADLSEFRENAFILFNVAVGGVWPGYPDQTTVFPQTMKVDYVRVYQDAAALPKITIAEPQNAQNFQEGTPIKISTDIDFDGVMDKVEFYQDQVLIGVAEDEPYEMNWYDVKPGTYTIQAKTLTAQGYQTVSESVQIQVGSSVDISPYKGFAAMLPGIIEAENYDLGGQGLAYNDADAGNSGATYRTSEGVDIEKCTDENGGYNIGWIAPGEWLSYQVNVLKAGSYNFDFRVASNGGGGTFYVEMNGENKSGTVSAPNTGGWQNWQTVTVNDIELSEGFQTLKFHFSGGSFNLNYLAVYPADGQAILQLLSPIGGETWQKSTDRDIRWFGWDVNSIRILYSTDAGANWTHATTRAASDFGIYRWSIPDVESNECLVRIVDRSDATLADTSTSYFTIDNATTIEKPEKIVYGFKLFQAYPNPFNPTTTLRFNMPYSGQVELSVYKMTGEKVATLASGYFNAGEHSEQWNATGFASGVYICRISNDHGFAASQKLILIK
ncbi:MAG: family 16 glycosylhydrolase [Calditrichae bacterium]|nr:family 16 glycosylhydrolase [Calditrichia bacterium]